MLRQALNVLSPLPFIFFAEISVAPNQLFIWLGVLTFLVLLANALFTFWRNITGNLKEEPPPARTYQTKTLCEAIHAGARERADRFEEDVDARITGLATRVGTHRQQVEEEISKERKVFNDAMQTIQDKFGAIMRALGRLEGRKDGHALD